MTHQQQQGELTRLMTLLDINMWDHPAPAPAVQERPPVQKKKTKRKLSEPSPSPHPFPVVLRWPEVDLNKPSQTLFDDRPTSEGVESVVMGGESITEELATKLRERLFGTCQFKPDVSWRDAHFSFYDLKSPWPYGLKCMPQSPTQAVLLCVQCQLLKTILFPRVSDKSVDRDQASVDEAWRRRGGRFALETELLPSFDSRKALRKISSDELGRADRGQLLAVALKEALWKCGEGQRATVCLPAHRPVFEPKGFYNNDGVTENIRMFHFDKEEECLTLLRRHIAVFQSPKKSGLLLFLYSCVLSRGLEGINRDMDGSDDTLTGLSQAAARPLINLLLTGRASRFLHNNILQIYDDEGNLAKGDVQTGIHKRSETGFLFWHRDEGDRSRTLVDSDLRTPKSPIWLTHINGRYAILFCLNPDLICHYSVENYFTMFYYTGLSTPQKQLSFIINNREKKSVVGKTALHTKLKREKIPALERCIMTKWKEAIISPIEGEQAFW